jgi:hypothetical protein
MGIAMIKGNDHDRCRCVSCEDGIDAAVEMEQQFLRTHGWYAHVVPENYHTHGIPMSFGHHPDIQVVLPISPDQVHQIVAGVVEKIKEGTVFVPGERVAGIIRGMDVMFVEAMEGNNHAVLRMILPDPNGNLDRQTMDPMYAAQYDGISESKV